MHRFHPRLPNPGSHHAMKNGCLCPMIENQFGLGDDLSGRSVHWIINPDCIIHTAIWDRLNRITSQPKEQAYVNA